MHLVAVKGKIVYANGASAPGVTVRVFDRDDPNRGNPDDNLTIQPAQTDAEGAFRVQFDLDRNAEPFDPLTPYLLLSYSINGFARQFRQNFNFIPFLQTEVDLGHILLPEYLLPPFTPSVQGFHFINSFPGVALPFDLPIPSFNSQTHGLCGGMVFAAMDFAIYGRTIPATKQVPRKGTRLHLYIYGRLLDSFGPGFRNVFKLQNWLSRPDSTVNGLNKLTLDEFIRFRSKLDMKQMLPLFVMLDRQALWNSHHVLAHSYTEKPDHSVDIQIYDPNFPDEDVVIMRCSPVEVGPGGGVNVPGFACRIIRSNNPTNSLYNNCYGFFDSGYSPKFPPPGL